MKPTFHDARIKKAILINDHGTPDAQKAELVSAILNCFQDPSKWPLTDFERIDLLRALYYKAQQIRETEAACVIA